ncbi:hypothetical protein CEXT_556831 [Caerostris extrusa]|uniref:Uncharacterized protein n=1 Tax=Caerostris extrusa TaxID=172846 RepID=A0AAV4SBE9_CAEEX|nr:hypothetical protein CEXT_556831 [Caerostris extrusa]
MVPLAVGGGSNAPSKHPWLLLVVLFNTRGDVSSICEGILIDKLIESDKYVLILRFILDTIMNAHKGLSESQISGKWKFYSI